MSDEQQQGGLETHTARPPQEPLGQPARGKRLLEAMEVTAGYSNVPVVQEVSLEVGLGEIVLVMGPNGAGKSTLVKAITGQLPLLSGALVLDGADISRLREEERIGAGVGYVPQTRDVFGPLSVLENLQMGAYRLRPRETKERLEEIYSLFPALRSLTRRTARTLSGGEKKMLAISRALIAQPRLLILDEPTSNLAPQIAASVLERVVGRLAAAGRAVLLIEQRVSLALQVASWGYVLVDGRVRLQGAAEQLRSTPDLGALFLGRGGTGITSTAPTPGRAAEEGRRAGG